MSHLVDDLLTASTIDTGHFSVELGPQPPSKLLNEAIELNEPAMRVRGLVCERSWADDLP